MNVLERGSRVGSRNHKKTLASEFSLGWFLAVREIRRASLWTTVLITAVMMFTFLNLIVVNGILVGLIQGSEDRNRIHYTSDVILSVLPKKSYIQESNDIIAHLESMPEVQDFTYRYTAAGSIEANYKTKTRPDDVVDKTAGLVSGIDLEREGRVTKISQFLVEGSYLDESSSDEILIGANLLYKYSPIESPGFSTLKNVEAGSRVRLIVNGLAREVTVKGVLKAKLNEIDTRIIMNANQLRKLIGRFDYNVDEIAVKLKDPNDASLVKTSLERAGFGEKARIQTWEEAQPKFLKDIKGTFSILGNMIGSIGLVVASITIFIVIFVNAITRRRYIGILKGIGVSSRTIEFSYVIQSIFYAVCGIAIGLVLVFGFLKPYIAAHPINFPFSDGILVADSLGTSLRVLALLFATVIAGFIPARIVVRQNTLDAILGRS